MENSISKNISTELELAAIHESGHLIVLILNGREISSEGIKIDNSGDGLCCRATHYFRRDELLDFLQSEAEIYLAGDTAEQIFKKTHRQRDEIRAAEFLSSLRDSVNNVDFLKPLGMSRSELANTLISVERVVAPVRQPDPKCQHFFSDDVGYLFDILEHFEIVDDGGDLVDNELYQNDDYIIAVANVAKWYLKGQGRNRLCKEDKDSILQNFVALRRTVASLLKLGENWQAVEMIAAQLLRKRKLSGKDIGEIFKDTDIIDNKLLGLKIAGQHGV